MTNLSTFRQSGGLCGLTRQGQIMLMQFHMQRLLSTQYSKNSSMLGHFPIFPGTRFMPFIIAKQQYGPQVAGNTLLCGLA